MDTGVERTANRVNSTPAATVERTSIDSEQSKAAHPTSSILLHLAPLAAIFVLALALRVWGVRWSLPYVGHVDEPKIVDSAVEMVKTGDLNPHLFIWPSLYIYLQAALFKLHLLWGMLRGLYPGPEALPDSNHVFALAPGLYVWGRTLSAVIGAAAVAGLFALGRAMFNWRVGLAAALVLLASPLHVEYSHYLVTDVAVGFFGLLTLAASWRLLARPGFRTALLCGALVGLTAATKYNGVYVAMVPFTALLLAPLPAREASWRHGIARLVSWGGAMLLVAAGLFLLANPYIILDWTHWSRGFTFQVEAYVPAETLGQVIGSAGEHVAMLWTTDEWLLAPAALGALLLLAGAARRGQGAGGRGQGDGAHHGGTEARRIRGQRAEGGGQETRRQGAGSREQGAGTSEGQRGAGDSHTADDLHESPATHHSSPATRHPSLVTRHSSPVTRLWLYVLLLIPFPIVYTLLMSRFKLVYERNLIITLPFLCLLAGYLIDRAAALIGRIAANPSRARQYAIRNTQYAIAAALAVLLAAEPARQMINFDRYMSGPESRNVAAEWLMGELREGRRAAVELHPLAFCAPPPHGCPAPDVLAPNDALTDQPPEWYARRGYDYVVLSGEEYLNIGDPAKDRQRDPGAWAAYGALPGPDGGPRVFAGDRQGGKGPTVTVLRVGPGIEALAVMHKPGARFGDVAELWGYDLAPLADAGERVDPLESRARGAFERGGAIGLNLYWRALREGAAVPGNWTVAVHLIAGDGSRVAQIDVAPISHGRQRPVREWYANEFVPGAYNLPIDPGLPPGEYALRIALYDAPGGPALKAAMPDGRQLDYLTLGPIEIR